MQQSLFSQSKTKPNVSRQCEFIPLQDGGLYYFPQWLSPALATLYFKRLQNEVDWQQSVIKLAGKQVKIPRLNAWYGDENATYQYSGKQFEPLPWNRSLLVLRQRLQGLELPNGSRLSCNSALLNCYRDGNDSVAWHADDEKELGPNPLISSLSVGASRRFLLKRRDGGERLSLDLEHGSLLVMMPPLQRYWLHSIPKTKRSISTRVNVTFRQVTVQ